MRVLVSQTSANSVWSRSVIMSNNNASSSSVAVAQKAVKQLRLEAKIRRINNAHKDPLLVGVPSSDNPFRPPKSCGLL
ncbi:Guanine nucleotide-binding protein G(I)/G(S)/G(O) subunit gamma-12 [Labeo rohita]|uniref:Guanine nucleotide-binding protein G(I)/G(S)/G(O) subunit gamma-12 n=1 Tax=Labeo rohita TaxID=84645 RepID=A0ABQ8MZ06_LABRO|nr:Guanine nucleotide-binding protein G(I)/G(S)/G(O) subunit gamma-12 [Labeo rohita]